MTRTFLVALELGDSSDLGGYSEAIQEALEEDGLPVTSVTPWGQAQTAAPVDSFSSDVGQTVLPTVPSTFAPPGSYLGH